jgi:hypothetical protein
MDNGPSPERLVELFERDLRDSDPGRSTPASSRKSTAPRVSRELDQQVAAFASEVRTSGRTPEQMLVQLKRLLTTAAPDVSSSERSAFLASITKRAIDAFFGQGTPRKKS